MCIIGSYCIIRYIIITTLKYKKKFKKNFWNIKFDTESLTMMASYNFIVILTIYLAQYKNECFYLYNLTRSLNSNIYRYIINWQQAFCFQRCIYTDRISNVSGTIKKTINMFSTNIFKRKNAKEHSIVIWTLRIEMYNNIYVVKTFFFTLKQLILKKKPFIVKLLLFYF